jgi:hypothetical protein
MMIRRSRHIAAEQELESVLESDRAGNDFRMSWLNIVDTSAAWEDRGH